MRTKHKSLVVAMFVAMVIMSIFGQTASAQEKKKAKIIEKGTTRYFQLGGQEYACSADNRISDASAKQILKTVRKIYSSTDVMQDTKKEHDAIIDSIWNTFHQVCMPGEVYDEILFVALKYKLHNFFLTKLTPVRSNTKECKVLVGELLIQKTRWASSTLKTKATRRPNNLVVNYFTYNGLAGVHLYSGNSYKKRTWNSKHVGSVVYEGLSTRPNSVWTGGRRLNLDDLTGDIIKDVNDGVIRILQSKELLKKKTKVLDDNFCNLIRKDIEHFLLHIDETSFILDSEFDLLLRKLPRLTWTLPKGENQKGDYDQHMVKVLTTKVLEMSLRFCQTDKAKKEMVEFGKEKELDFAVPKPKDSKNKKLF